MKKLLIIVITCIAGQVCFSQATYQKLDELLTAYARLEKFNGTALVAQKGTVLLQKGYGMKDAGKSLPNDVNTVYQIGSVTKQFTAALILRLQEEKKLGIQDKLSKYFPDFPNAGKITIENLLTHTSGIYNYTNDRNFMENEITHSYSMDKIMALFKDKPLDFEPGSKWSYSNSGYLMLGYIIEKVTNKPYYQVMHEYILQPLQMNHTGFDFTRLKSTDKATGHLASNAVAPIVDSSVSFSAGAMYSTVGDLFKWERAIHNNRVIKAESWKPAFTVYKSRYGYGWFIDSLFNRQAVMHGGGIHGFNANMFRIPQEEIVIILLNNKNTASLDTITKSIAAILLNQKYEIPREQVAVTVKDSILEKYTGEYELTPALKFTITKENGNLKGQLTGQPSFDMFAKNETFFFLKVVDAQIEFVNDADGKTTQLILYQGGQKMPAKKIK